MTTDTVRSDHLLKKHAQAAAVEAGGQCCLTKETGQRCSGTAVEAHHIRYRSRGGGDEYENLAILCSDHHRKVHGGFLVWHDDHFFDKRSGEKWYDWRDLEADKERLAEVALNLVVQGASGANKHKWLRSQGLELIDRESLWHLYDCEDLAEFLKMYDLGITERSARRQILAARRLSQLPDWMQDVLLEHPSGLRLMEQKSARMAELPEAAEAAVHALQATDSSVAAIAAVDETFPQDDPTGSEDPETVVEVEGVVLRLKVPVESSAACEAAISRIRGWSSCHDVNGAVSRIVEDL